MVRLNNELFRRAKCIETNNTKESKLYPIYALNEDNKFSNNEKCAEVANF